MLYGNIEAKLNDDGSVSLDASHCTADGGGPEIEKALRALAVELGGEWKQEKHLLRNVHHSHAGVDHHLKH
jgi:hypothetical protein